ncbi:MAG: error-prone DNA polymerase [Proteobacteria bacterium]|nr:error-prone DNA polymerase [Pseudomonadota bacterium]
MSGYIELQVTSNYSFLEGASHPGELVRQAAAIGHAGAALADRNTLAGVVRAHVAAKETGSRFLVGARLVPMDGPSLVCFPTDRAAYGRLCRLITLGRRRAPKGECHFTLSEVMGHGEGQVFLALPPDRPEEDFAAWLQDFARRFSGSCYLAAPYRYDGTDARRLRRLSDLAAAAGAPLVATNDVHYHLPERRPLQDVLTCIRAGTTIAAAGRRLAANAERHLKPAEEMARLFHGHGEAVLRTLEIAQRCRFSLDELRYEYPEEITGEGRSPQAELQHQTWTGAARRYPEGVPEAVRRTLIRELALIEDLSYAPYFLTVFDIVRYARSKDILCQGRGSAANSAVCYVLGITAVDPSAHSLLFERFVSAARNEPPDIDVDFEHERREEVIQYVYGKYGRERAGIAATVIAYRSRSAVRDVGKALGLSEDTVGALAGSLWGWGAEGVDEARVREIGLDPADRTLRLALDLARELIGFPRHLSQHVGGFVISRGPLSELVPIANAAMAERTNVEWDKDDLDALGILKIDVLALGMLTCIRKAFQLIEQHKGQRFDMAGVPEGDPAVYDMLCRGDSLGVFQVESRAQMSMLPRLKPRTLYDLVIEVAIVRPGPIQGDMVHPYLRRRNGEETVSYPSRELARVLGKTLGVPLFQEQAMQIAIVAAGFTPTAADELRRAMATFRRNGDIHRFRTKLIEGMVAKGYERDFAARCFRQIEGFGTYGFPESHAISFALLVYVSSWLKCHHPEVFACALLNAQQMGFYAPAQIVRDAAEHGVEVRPVDVNASHWDCTLEPAAEGEEGQPRLALRLGFRQVQGARAEDIKRLVEFRGTGYGSPRALWLRAGLSPAALESLARADAFRSQGLGRREALWAVKDLGAEPLPLFAEAETAGPVQNEPLVRLPSMPIGEEVVEDYASLRLSLKRHPVALLRDGLGRDGLLPAQGLAELASGRWIKVAGLVLVRQRPGSANGIVFITLEDETGVANLVVYPDIFERYRRAILGARLLAAWGSIDRQGMVIHVKARRFVDLSQRLDQLGQSEPAPEGSIDALARAEAVKRRPPALKAVSRDFH